MYVIPKELVAEWDRVKKGVPTVIDKIKGGGVLSEADKKRLKAQFEKLLGEFDQGLKAKMKVAAAAKDDASSRKASATVAGIVGDYRASVKKYAASWGTEGKAIADSLDKVLVRIGQHAEASTKSRAPIAVPKDWLTSLETALKAAVAQVPKLGLDDEDEDELKKATQTFVEHLEVILKPKINAATLAKSDDDLRKGLNSLVNTTESARREVLAWTKEHGKGSVPIAKALDFTTSKLVQNARTLLAKVT
jgi:hypothetical protein